MSGRGALAALAVLATTALPSAVEVVPARRAAQHDPALYQHGRAHPVAWSQRRKRKRTDVLAARKRERQARAKQRRTR